MRSGRHLAAFLACLAVGACSQTSQTPANVVTFVHATDPHIFEEPGRVDRFKTDADRLRQEQANQRTFAAALRAAGDLPRDGRRAFMVLTGDIGLDSSWTLPPANTANTAPGVRQNRADEINAVVSLFKANPVSDVFVVAGNNDIADESADPRALLYHTAFIEAVQRGLDSAGVATHVRDLTACYAGSTRPDSDCYADIPGSTIRLIGFPSYSFKNGPSVDAINRPLQDAAAQRFQRLVEAAAAQGLSVIVLDHIPELADPLAVALGNAPTRPRDDTTQLNASAWNVDAAVLRSWHNATQSDAVIAVLAGHFHDVQRSIYQEPYTWSPRTPLLGEPTKLLIAPPLAIKRQENSAVTSRGLSLVRVAGGRVTRQLLWYDPRLDAFTGSAAPVEASPAPRTLGWISRPVAFLWGLAEHNDDLAKVFVWAIAAFIAFLAVVQLWSDGIKRPALTDPKQNTNTPPSPSPTPTVGANAGWTNLFSSNFAKTALAGLLGLATLNVVVDSSFLQATHFNVKALYAVLYIVLFVVILIVVAVFRGAAEALRARIVLGPQPEHRPGAKPPTGKLGDFMARHGRAFWRWIFSFRLSALVFFDAFFNMIMGQDIAVSAAFSDRIHALNWSVVGGVERIRDYLESAAFNAVRAKCPDVDPSAIRASVSLLSLDAGSVFYLSPSRRNLRRPFPRKSIAWLAITHNTPLWWSAGLSNDTVLLTDEAKTPLKLSDWFQSRDADYEAFIVIPFPWAGRGAPENSRSGAIHIACKTPAYFKALFPGIDLDNQTSLWNPANAWQRLLDASDSPCRSDEPDKAGEAQAKPGTGASATSTTPKDTGAPTEPMITDPEFRAALRQAVEVLPDLCAKIDDTLINDTVPAASPSSSGVTPLPATPPKPLPPPPPATAPQ